MVVTHKSYLLLPLSYLIIFIFNQKILYFGFINTLSILGIVEFICGIQIFYILIMAFMLYLVSNNWLKFRLLTWS